MAQNLVGNLILRLQDQATPGIRKISSSLDGLMGKIRNLGNGPSGDPFGKVSSSAKRLQSDMERLTRADWGASFQARIEKLGASARHVDQLRSAYDRLASSIGNASKKDQARAFSEFKTSALASLTAVRMEAERTKRSLTDLVKAGAAGVGLGTGAYVAGRLGAGLMEGGSTRAREELRQKMAGLTKEERDKITAESVRLSTKFQSASTSTVMEMGRSAVPFMGSTDRAMEVLEGMTRAFVVLQSAKGIDQATSEISGLLRGIDNLGKNEAGQLGIKNTLDIINGITKAVQVEGKEFDAAKLWEFARRSKIAGPALSTDFIMSTAPAFMQDMTASGFGTALSSAFKAIVTGASDNASVDNLAEQGRLGLRTGMEWETKKNGKRGKLTNKGGAVGAELFSQDPFEWVKTVLKPALERDGVDISNTSQLITAVDKLSRNSLVTGLLTRMLQQEDQIEKLRASYARAQGISAADKVQTDDPFAAWKAFKNQFENLAGAIGLAAAVVPSLNFLTEGLNQFARAIEKMSLKELGLAGGLVGGVGGAAAVGGAAVAAKGLLALVGAGPALMGAATALTAAAAKLGGAGGVPGLPDGGGKKGGGKPSGIGALGKVLVGATVAGGVVGGLSYGNNVYKDDLEADTPEGRALRARRAQKATVRGLMLADRSAALAGSDEDIDRGEIGRQRKLSVDTTALIEAQRKAEETGQVITDKVGVTVKPEVDLSSLMAAEALAGRVLSKLGQIGAASRDAAGSMNGAFSDFGVAP